MKMSTWAHMMGINLEIVMKASNHHKRTTLIFAKRAQRASLLSVILAPNLTGKASHLLRFRYIQGIKNDKLLEVRSIAGQVLCEACWKKGNVRAVRP